MDWMICVSNCVWVKTEVKKFLSSKSIHGGSTHCADVLSSVVSLASVESTSWPLHFAATKCIGNDANQ